MCCELSRRLPGVRLSMTLTNPPLPTRSLRVLTIGTGPRQYCATLGRSPALHERRQHLLERRHHRPRVARGEVVRIAPDQHVADDRRASLRAADGIVHIDELDPRRSLRSHDDRIAAAERALAAIRSTLR